MVIFIFITRKKWSFHVLGKVVISFTHAYKLIQTVGVLKSFAYIAEPHLCTACQIPIRHVNLITCNMYLVTLDIVNKYPKR